MAIAETLKREVPHPNGVRLILQQRREARDQPPPVGIRIDNERAQKLVVQPHDLHRYDQLQSSQEAVKKCQTETASETQSEVETNDDSKK